MKMVRKLGWRRALRLFWGVLKEKYFPKNTYGTYVGRCLLVSLVLGLIFIIEPVMLMHKLDQNQRQLEFVVAMVGLGLILLVMPVSVMVFLWRDINRNFDKFLEEMG